MLVGLSAALSAAFVFGFAAIVQARAVRRLAPSGGPVSSGRPGACDVPGVRGVPSASEAAEASGRFFVQLLREPLFLAAIGLNLVGFVLHLVAIRLIPLYLAQAGISLSLAVTAVLAVLMMREHLTHRDWVAVSAITLGLVLLAMASGDIGTAEVPDGFVGWLFLGVLAVGLVGLAVSRSRSHLAAGVLGFLAGLGFAGSGLCARVLPGLTPAELLGAPATYLLPVSGGLAFLLYSLALRRGTVTEATGPLIVMQTVTPALIGVWVLGDEVRSGWGSVALVGFALSLVGAVELARFESGSEMSATAP
jgi:drug/metabolite transporter (DMT)-like permease